MQIKDDNDVNKRIYFTFSKFIFYSLFCFKKLNFVQPNFIKMDDLHNKNIFLSFSYKKKRNKGVQYLILAKIIKSKSTVFC